jgi:hypothetical protein
MAKSPAEGGATVAEERAHKRTPHKGEVKKVTGDLAREVIEKQRAAHDSQRKWLNGMQDELKKGENK